MPQRHDVLPARGHACGKAKVVCCCYDVGVLPPRGLAVLPRTGRLGHGHYLSILACGRSRARCTTTVPRGRAPPAAEFMPGATSRLLAMLTGHDAVLVAAVAARERRVLATAAAWRQTPMMPAIIARTDHNQALDDDEDDDAVAARGPRCCTRLVPSAVVSRGAHGQHARGAEQASRPRHASRLSYMHNSRVRFWPPPSITSREREFGSAVFKK